MSEQSEIIEKLDEIKKLLSYLVEKDIESNKSKISEESKIQKRKEAQKRYYEKKKLEKAKQFIKDMEEKDLTVEEVKDLEKPIISELSNNIKDDRDSKVKDLLTKIKTSKLSKEDLKNKQSENLNKSVEQLSLEIENSNNSNKSNKSKKSNNIK